MGSGAAQAMSAMLDALRSGVTVYLTGAPGSGKTHALGAARKALEADGRDVVLVAAGEEPEAHLTVPVGEKPRIVLIDDADRPRGSRLDLVHDLAEAGIVVAAAIPALGMLSARARAHVRSGRALALSLPALSEEESLELTERELGGGVDDRAVRVLHERSGGNPRSLRELLRVAVAAGTLSLGPGGVWHLRGDPPSSAADDPFVGMSGDVRGAVITVALGEPLPVAVAIDAVESESLESAEERGLIRLDVRANVLRIQPPLSRDSVLSATKDDELRAARARLEQVWSGHDDSDAALRITLLALDFSPLPSADALLTLAERFLSEDPPLSARLLELARPVCRTPTERLRLAAILSHRHESAAAQEVLESIRLDDLPRDVRLGVVITRAFIDAMPEQRPDAALRSIDAAIAEFGPVPLALAVRATALWRSGLVDDAMAQARLVVEDADAPMDARAHAALTLGAAAHLAADRRVSEEMFDWVEAHGATAGPGLPEAVESARLTREYARATYGDSPRDLLVTADEGYQRALNAGDDGVRAHFAYHAAAALLYAGEVERAIERIEAVRPLEGIWIPTMAVWRSALEVRVYATAGRSDDMDAARLRLRGLRCPPIFEGLVVQAEAAGDAALGDIGQAIRRLREGAEKADESQMPVMAITLRYEAVALSDAAAAAALGRVAPGLLSPGQLTHARALADDDLEGLTVAVQMLQHEGHRLYAAAAAGCAILTAHARSDRGQLSAAWRLFDASQGKTGAVLPVLAAQGHRLLTPRQWQIADRAAAGESDAEIATDLNISPRTVQVHLSAAFAALGVTSRQKLKPKVALFNPARRAAPHAT
ncbi:LuxR C-terminal-related transcriptional regulator [Microbacterium sp.]|uniref:helix-turn-helix transcriptional regulator n=1 Tax=Microbacterium sp. TaxID=51671 RepID=UPI003C197DAA